MTRKPKSTSEGITTPSDPVAWSHIFAFYSSLLHKKFSRFEVTIVNHTFSILTHLDTQHANPVLIRNQQ
jgi:hypothetical protein